MSSGEGGTNVENMGPNVEPKPGWPANYPPGLPHGPAQPPGWIGVDSRTHYEADHWHAGREKTRVVTWRGEEWHYEYAYKSRGALAYAIATNGDGVKFLYTELEGQLVLNEKTLPNGVVLEYAGEGLATYKQREHHPTWHPDGASFFPALRDTRAELLFAPDHDVADNPDHVHKVKAVLHYREGDVVLHYSGEPDRRSVCQIDTPDATKRFFGPGKDGSTYFKLPTRTERANGLIKWFKPIPHDPGHVYMWQAHMPGRAITTYDPPRAPQRGAPFVETPMTEEEMDEANEEAEMSLTSDCTAYENKRAAEYEFDMDNFRGYTKRHC